MDINKMKREATTHYNNSPRQVQDLIHQFFKSMDANGDKGVDFYEIQSFLRGRTFLTRFLNGDIYRQLDSDGNGTLDFEEFITLFYILFMCYTCVVCQMPLRGQKHLTCGACFTSAEHTGITYDICVSCFSRGYFRHEHAYLVDYYTMFLDEGSGHGASNNNSSQPPQGQWSGMAHHQPANASQLTSRSQNSRRIFGQLYMILEAVAAVSTTATAASAGLCNIM